MTNGGERSRWALSAGIAVTIVFASVVPLPGGGDASPVVPLGVDTWLHAAGYAALSVSMARAHAAGRRSTLLSVVLAALTATVFGVGIEILQTAVPTRGFELHDIGANAAGCLLGVTGWVWLRGRR